MLTKDRSFRIVSGIVAVLSLCIFIASRFARTAEEEKSLRPHLKGILELDAITDTSRALVVGYNYHLLQKYAEKDGRTVDIRLRERNAVYIDSLKSGAIDILVIPYEEGLVLDSISVSAPVDSLSLWLMREEDSHEMDNIRLWLEEWYEDETYHDIRRSYMRRYNVFRSRKRTRISPYDEIIMVYADSLGCDWRLLAAIIYQESRFHIEARSYRGACGLMQMMPRTASYYGVENQLDPEDNIRAGTALLRQLIRKYSSVAGSPEESFKYALAAYNAGAGRIDDLIRVAEFRGADTSQWDSVAVVIPEMRDAAVVDTVGLRTGAFNGEETMAYVHRVISIYEQFKRICPERVE